VEASPNKTGNLSQEVSTMGSMTATEEVRRFKTENPEWDDLPDEVVEKTMAYRQWLLNNALDDLGQAILEGLRDIPLIGKWLR
jgi:hypothetical protein